jgi:multicomponent Na+:H+ antiporter subunit F
MMDTALGAAVVFLLVNLVAGLWRVVRGPTVTDRILPAVLFGSTTVAMLLIMAQWLDLPSLRTVALLFVLLAAVITLAFTGRSPREGEP